MKNNINFKKAIGFFVLAFVFLLATVQISVGYVNDKPLFKIKFKIMNCQE